MAYKFLPTNFKDDIINTEINERRQYRMIQNDDGTVSFEDVTDYSQKGDLFGGGNINDINDQINRINRVGWYSRCLVDTSRIYPPQLIGYTVADVEYDEKIGRITTANREHVEMDIPSSEWEIDLQPGKYYALTLNYYDFIKDIVGDNSGDIIVQLMGLVNVGNGAWPYCVQLAIDSVSYSRSQFMYLTIYNFSDKVYRKFDAYGLALIYEIRTRLKEIND